MHKTHVKRSHIRLNTNQYNIKLALIPLNK